MRHFLHLQWHPEASDFILFKKEKHTQDEGLEEEYDEEDDYEIMRKRKKAIEELAATLEEETEDAGDPQEFQELQDALEEENDSAEEFLMKKIFMWKRTC